MQELEDVTLAGGGGVAACASALGVVGPWGTRAGVFLPNESCIAKDALIDFTGAFDGIDRIHFTPRGLADEPAEAFATNDAAAKIVGEAPAAAAPAAAKHAPAKPAASKK